MKRTLQILSLAVLVILLGSFTFAWFNNNLVTDVEGTNTLKIESSGVLQIAYAKSEDGTAIACNSSEAKYGSTLSMNIGTGGYDDITGNGLVMYAPAFDASGNILNYEPAQADDAAVVGDAAGKYVIMDLYFRSDLPMDIYLMKKSSVLPVEDPTGKLGLTKNTGYVNIEDFSSFTNGLPSLNINQSAYGLFSRNLIAGAARVAFIPYPDSDSEWDTLPKKASLIWVPNSNYMLTQGATSAKLDHFSQSGNKELTYQYRLYRAGDTEFVKTDNDYKTILRHNGEISGKLLPELYREVDGELIAVTTVMLQNDKFIPAIVSGSVKYPAIWDSSKGDFVIAYYNDDCEGYVAVEYRNGEAAYRLMDGTYVQEDGSGYLIVEKAIDTEYGTAYWKKTTTSKTFEDIESLFISDGATYSSCYWIEDDAFSKKVDQSNYCSKYAVAHTDYLTPGAAACYGKLRVSIWVEGTDREADIALNGGEFNVNLAFYGINASE